MLNLSQLSRNQMIIVGAAAFAVLLIIIAVIMSRDSSQAPPKIALAFWGVEDKSVFSDVFKNYKAVRPNVTVEYRAFREEEYEDALLDALASGKGPDVFMIPAHALGRQKSKLAPSDPARFSLAKLKELFPTVVEQDFASGGQVYALPLYIDTLALIYNPNLLDQAAVVRPPQIWDEVQYLSTVLRKLDERGRLSQSAVALGGSEKSVAHAGDILSLLMMQNGAAMNQGNSAAFANDKGLKAFNFYLQFGASGSPYYTWDESQPNSLDAFASGKTAMILGYHRDLARLKDKSPFSNFRVSAVPQTGETKNFADYWGLAVSRQSKNWRWGWNFVISAATDAGSAKSYAAAAKRPPALRSLIAQKLSDAEYGVFAKQALTARSWPQPDERKVSSALNEAILSVVSGKVDASRALTQAQGEITRLLQAANK